jgi:L-iditol 2-dehydrogenase
MKAVYCTAPEKLEMKPNEPEPALASADDVIIRVAYCGICPWDVRVFNGRKQVPLPRILGHEATGTVTAVGDGVKDLAVGARVVADFILKCGVCPMCRTGRSNKCTSPVFLKGGFEEYVKIPRRNVFPLRDGTSLKAAALTEPLACVVRGQKMLKPAPGKVEIIVGAGPIGLLHMQTAAAFGARTIVIDLIDSRLEKAKALGADLIINGSSGDRQEKVKEFTGGLMADAAVVTVPNTAVVRSSIDLLGNGARLNIFAGIYPQDQLTIDPNIIHYRELNILGSADSTHEDFIDALALIESGRIGTESLISDLVLLEKLDEGFKKVNERGGLKVVVELAGER